MFKLNLATFGVEEKFRPMVVDVLKVTVVAIIIRLLSQNAGVSAGTVVEEFFSNEFINKILFQAVGFIFFWAIVYQSVDIKLK